MNQMSSTETGQITADAARVYDARFVPALFAQFAPWLVEFAKVATGSRVLDIATGTGIAAIAALDRGAHVTGLDLNPGMLAVARRKSVRIAWIEGDAAALTFADDSFDTVLCQFGAMFFPDRGAALTEMHRVMRPGGTLALAVFASLAETPVYRDLVPMLDRIVGPDAAEALTAPFILGDTTTLAAEIEAAGFSMARTETVTGTARHPSLDGWLDTEVGGWTISETVTPDQLAAIKTEARETFAQHIARDGSLAFPAPAHFLLARKP